MKPILFLFLMIASTGASFAQTKEVIVPLDQITKQQDNFEPVYVSVDLMPVFNYKNGESTSESFLKYVNDSIKIPSKDCFGKLYVQFVVKPDSTVKDVRILRGLDNCKDYKKEVERILTSMPKWIPGKRKGKAVSVLFTMPIDIHPND